ncbi:MAG: glucose-6-phosphate isomerase [Bacteroidales bacterium]|nr:glucose-6-phosphate isomerase [Bacteroidales bacterium]
MIDLKVNIDKLEGFVSKESIYSFEKQLVLHQGSLLDKTGKGNDFLGWITLPDEIDEAMLTSLEKDAHEIAAKADIYVVIGIGGSYLGARAVIEALQHNFAGLQGKADRKTPLVVYAGNNISEDYLADLIDILDKRDYALTVISKSGTTTEPAIAFRILRRHLEQKYGRDEARKRIIAITDGSKGALKKLADSEGYKTYVVPDDVGGRYSVLTPVGLLPVAVAGFDIRAFVQGARAMKEVVTSARTIDDNPAFKYAAARNALYAAGKPIEIMVNYQPSLIYITEWWKQLYGESEGKQNRGIFPAGVSFTTDLHSMGQYVQEGLRVIFETVLSIEKPKRELSVPREADDADGLNFVSGRRIHEVNRQAELGTLLAHVDGNVPNMVISLPRVDENTLGQLLYFYEFACALSGYILDVNPFDQPGVEAYKRNMFALLGKPGFEEQTAVLRSRI